MAKRIYVGVPTEAGTETVDVALKEGNVGEFFSVTDGASPFAWTGSAYVAGRETSQSKSETFTSAWTARTDVESVTLDWEVIGGSGPFTMEVNGQSVANSELNDSGTWTGSLSAGGVVEFGFVLGSGATGTANVKATVKTQRETASGNVARKVKKLYVGVGGIANRRLPEGYTQVEYVQSDGASYFDTGFVPNQDTKVMMDALIPSEPSSIAVLFGARPNEGSSSDCVMVLRTASGVVRSYYDDSYKDMSGVDSLARLSVLKDKASTNVNGVTATHTYAEFSSAGSLFLSAMNAGGVATWHAALRIYSCSVYDNDKTMRFYVPCISPDGVVGLFDLVSMEFNAGVGSFTAGPAVATEEYDEQGIARKIKKAYIGVGGVARPFWGGGELAYYGTVPELDPVRSWTGAAAVNGHALFGGGCVSVSSPYADVEAYDRSLTKTKPVELTSKGFFPATAPVGGYALFAGGSYVTSSNYSGRNTVDAYDESLTKSQLTALSSGTGFLAGCAVGGYALFGGGIKRVLIPSVIDTTRAYDESLSSSSPSTLSVARSKMAATSVGGYALFAGGTSSMSSYGNPSENGALATVDAYDESLSRTTPSALSYSRMFPAATTVGGYALFGGGINSSGANVSHVDAYDESLVRTTPTPLTIAGQYLTATTLEGYALFAGEGSRIVEAYDESLTKSQLTAASSSINGAASETVGDYAIFAGGSNSMQAYTIV